MTATLRDRLSLISVSGILAPGGGDMDPLSVSLAEKIIKAVGRPVARWVWQKVRTPPEVEAFLRVSAGAMAESAVFVKQRRDPVTTGDASARAWHQEAVGVLVHLLTSALDLEDLVSRFFSIP